MVQPPGNCECTFLSNGEKEENLNRGRQSLQGPYLLLGSISLANDDPLLIGKSDFYRQGERRGFQVLGIQGRFANPETDIFSLNKVGLNKVCSLPYSIFAGLWVLTD